MSLDRIYGAPSYVDLVDRILDKGIVIDAWMRASIGGIDLITVEAHLIVASIETYLAHCPACDGAGGLAKRLPIFDAG